MNGLNIKLIWFFVLLSLSIFPFSAQADYYLKFTTSGSSYANTGPLHLESGAWLDVSIVDVYPTDGPVHFEGSETGAWPGYSVGNWDKKGTNNLNFYYADVPRSIALIDKANGGNTVLTFGDPPIRFTGAPAILLPDSTLVAPGIARTGSSSYAIYVTAAKPFRRTADKANVDPDSFTYTNNNLELDCGQGWFQSGVNAEGVTIVISAYYSSQCVTRAAYSGFISHVVRME